MDLIPAEEGGDDYYLNGSYTKLKDAGKYRMKRLPFLQGIAFRGRGKSGQNRGNFVFSAN